MPIRILSISLIYLWHLACRSDLVQVKMDFATKPKIQRTVNTRVLAPRNYRQESGQNKEMINDFFSLELYAREFTRGSLIYLELLPKENVEFGSNPAIVVNSIPVGLKQFRWGYRGFFAIHPENGNRKVIIEIRFSASGKSITEYHSFELDERNFPVSRSALDVGKYSRTDLPVNQALQERIKKEVKQKENVFKLHTPDQLTEVLSHPRSFHQLTSPFYEKRIYEQYEIRDGKKLAKSPRISYHRGLDFYGRTGDPVFSMASGKVVLAENLYYEGNCVIVDHGNKILSIYMHLNKINAKEGQLIKPGDLIGYVGSTGISTGAHLHVSLYIGGIPVDPLSLLFLPIRD